MLAAAFSLTHPGIVGAVLMPVIFVVLIAIGRWLKRRQRVELGVLYLLFCIAVSIYLPLKFFGRSMMMPDARPATPPPSTQDARVASLEKQLAGLEESLKSVRENLAQPAPTAAPAATDHQLTRTRRHLGALVALLGTLVFLALVRRYFWEGWFERKNKTPAPKFLSQIFGLIIVLGAGMMILTYIYGKDLTAFVFGSTIVVGIIGFAMQDLLGNIIAGVALEIGKPFKTGDWLVVDRQHAEVIEVNWRSTRLRTNDGIYLDIPNKSIVGERITNLTYPTRQHAIRIRVGFDYHTPPNFVKDHMVRAAAHAPGVLTTPPPKVFLLDFADSAVTYEIKFWMDDQSKFNDICDAIRTNIWYEAQRNNIRIPFPIRTLQIEKPKPRHSDSLAAARTSVRKQPFLQLLDQAQTDKLLMNARLLQFGRGEKVIEQGEEGQSMFILLHGEADVHVKANGGETLVATLKGGDYFGEMSLLTGEPRSATVCAKVDCEMWEIDKPVLAEILQQNENLVQKLGELLARRRIETEGAVAATTERAELHARQREYTDGFLRKLYSFFEL